MSIEKRPLSSDPDAKIRIWTSKQRKRKREMKRTRRRREEEEDGDENKDGGENVKE